MSLDRFARSVEVTELTKLCFPYELYRTPSEMSEAATFPHFTQFESALWKPNPKFLTSLIELSSAKLETGEWTGLTEIEG